MSSTKWSETIVRIKENYGLYLEPKDTHEIANNKVHTCMYSDLPTVSRMRVSVDETSVEYLLGKRLDQLICSLKDKQLMK